MYCFLYDRDLRHEELIGLKRKRYPETDADIFSIPIAAKVVYRICLVRHFGLIFVDIVMHFASVKNWKNNFYENIKAKGPFSSNLTLLLVGGVKVRCYEALRESKGECGFILWKVT